MFHLCWSHAHIFDFLSIVTYTSPLKFSVSISTCTLHVPPSCSVSAPFYEYDRYDSQAALYTGGNQSNPRWRTFPLHFYTSTTRDNTQRLSPYQWSLVACVRVSSRIPPGSCDVTQPILHRQTMFYHRTARDVQFTNYNGIDSQFFGLISTSFGPNKQRLFTRHSKSVLHRHLSWSNFVNSGCGSLRGEQRQFLRWFCL